MRVAINAWFWNSPTTGSGQYTRHLVEHLAMVAPDLEIVLITPEGKIQNPKSQIPNVQFRLTANCYRLSANLDKIWFEQIAFPHACARLGADVGHVPYWAPPLRPSVPTVVTIHDLIPLLLREYRGGPLVRLYTAPDRVRVVYLAAGERYIPEPSPLRGGSRSGGRYVLYLGGFDVRKNVATVLRAYRRVGPVIGEQCPLVIAGRLPERDTPFTPDPRRLAREQGLDEKWVHFIGFVDEENKPALYRGAVAFIFPSRYEGFGPGSAPRGRHWQRIRTWWGELQVADCRQNGYNGLEIRQIQSDF